MSMRHASLAFFVAGLLAAPILGQEVAPRANAGNEFLKRVVTTANRVQGRILGWFVRTGMTQTEVDQILGSDPSRLDSGALIGGTIFWTWRYSGYGVTVSFLSDGAGVLRVSSIDFW